MEFVTKKFTTKTIHEPDHNNACAKLTYRGNKDKSVVLVKRISKWQGKWAWELAEGFWDWGFSVDVSAVTFF